MYIHTILYTQYSKERSKKKDTKSAFCWCMWNNEKWWQDLKKGDKKCAWKIKVAYKKRAM